MVVVMRDISQPLAVSEADTVPLGFKEGIPSTAGRMTSDVTPLCETASKGKALSSKNSELQKSGGHHETVHIGNSVWKLDHWHGSRGGQPIRLKRKRRRAEREPTTIRLFPAATAAARY